MNREDIIRMAREAGMERIVAIGIDGTQIVEITRLDLLERFADLVAAKEREECAMELERSKTHLDDVRLELAASTYFIASRVTEFLAARIRARGDA